MLHLLRRGGHTTAKVVFLSMLLFVLIVVSVVPQRMSPRSVFPMVLWIFTTCTGENFHFSGRMKVRLTSRSPTCVSLLLVSFEAQHVDFKEGKIALSQSLKLCDIMDTASHELLV